MVPSIPDKTSLSPQPLCPESRNAPRPSVGEHCVTQARAAAKETTSELNQSLALITNFHSVNRPVLLWKKVNSQYVWCILSQIINNHASSKSSQKF